MSTSINFPTIASPVWPLDEGREDGVIRSQFENGAEQSRLRFSRDRIDYQLRWTRMTTTDKGSLTTFFDTTTVRGSLSFNWTNPITSVTKEYRFTGPPKITAVDVGFWAVEFQIREV